WITTIVNGEILPKHERESLTNHSPEALIGLTGAKPSVEVHLGGGTIVPEIDRIGLFVVASEHVKPDVLRFTVSVSDDGEVWKHAGSASGARKLAPEDYPPDMVRGSFVLAPSIPLDRVYRSRYY